MASFHEMPMWGAPSAAYKGQSHVISMLTSSSCNAHAQGLREWHCSMVARRPLPPYKGSLPAFKGLETLCGVHLEDCKQFLQCTCIEAVLIVSIGSELQSYPCQLIRVGDMSLAWLQAALSMHKHSVVSIWSLLAYKGWRHFIEYIRKIASSSCNAHTERLNGILVRKGTLAS